MSDSATSGILAAASAAAVAEKQSGGEQHLSSDYLLYLSALQRHWHDCPSVSIAFKDLSYSIRNEDTIADAQARQKRERRRGLHSGDQEGATHILAKSEENTPNMAKAVLSLATSPFRLGKAVYTAVAGEEIDPEEVLQALHPSSGVIRPGSMTLVLAPPGAGKSTFLRAISGRLNGESGLGGELFFNGLSEAECKERGIHITRLASYVGQNDVAFPTLTVEETLEFAKKNGVADVNLLNPDEELLKMDAKRTELLMEMLGMMECRNTIIGNDMLRGISGGQKKRAQIGESLMSNARLYCLDEVSNGLDSAVTLHIFSTLKQACRISRSSIVTALQQVTPETYQQFDDVILMRDGRILYHGPREGVRDWLRDVMYVPFIPENIEEAGFLVDLLSDPKQAMDKAALAHRVAMGQATRPVAHAPSHSHSSMTHLSEVPPLKPSPSLPEAAAGAEEAAREESQAHEVVFHHTDEEEQEQETAAAVAPFMSPRKYDPEQPFKLSPEELHTVSDIFELTDRYLSSPYAFAVQQRLEESLSDRVTSEKQMDVSRWSAYSRSQYGRKFPHSSLRHTWLVSARQSKLMGRNLTMIVPRLINVILMGFVYGTLFFQLPVDDFASKLGLLQNAVMFMGFANFQELPVAAESKQVVTKQCDAGFYPPFSYTFAVNLMTLPLALAESVIFSILMYWIPGFVPDAGRYFFYLLCLLSINSAMSQVFRTVTYMAKNADVAHQLSMPFILLFTTFGGFLIPRSDVADWLIWAYYLSPFQWAAGSLAINEFSADVYDEIDSSKQYRKGDVYLESFGLRTEKIWMWSGILYLWAFYLFGTLISTLLLMYLKPTQPMGTKRVVAAPKQKQEHTEAEQPKGAQTALVAASSRPAEVAIEMASLGENGAAAPQKRLANTKSSARQSFQLSALPFTPATLVWKDLKYTVYVGKENKPKVLLNKINGYAKPGQLTALMGASGAGKTTLMDVIAGRKTVGLIESEKNILVNGVPKEPVSFASITGYVEQTDIHNGQATVREALEFSAKLRLPASVDAHTRDSFINEVMGLVGLTHIQNRMIGDVSQPSLSTGQLKLLTIAVELVANPSILFLDEPTTGLDSKSAYRVMRAIKRIAATNRTVVCTIHQPSQEVFFMFDRLLLLRPGGETVYFDDIGLQGTKLVSYLTRVSRNMLPYSPLVSPANWMLDVVGLDATALVQEQKAEQEAKAAENKGKVVEADEAQVQAAASDNLQAAFRSKLLAAHKSSAQASAADLDKLQPIQFSEEWRKSEESIRAQEELERLCSPSKHLSGSPSTASERPQYVGKWTRLLWVVRRAYISHWRSPPMNLTRCILTFCIGLFLGVVYYQVSAKDYSGMSSLMAAVFLGQTLPATICADASLSTFFRQRAVYYRESSVNMYGYLIYTLTMSLVEIPYMFVGLICYLLPYYWMVGLTAAAGPFFQFVLATFMMVLFFHSLHQVLLASMPNLISAQALIGFVFSMLFAFGGLFIKAAAMPIGWKWFYYIDPIPKAYIATMLTQVHCPTDEVREYNGDRIDPCRGIDIPGQEQKQMYAHIAGELDGSYEDFWPMFGWLVLTVGALRLLSIYLFAKVSHISR